MLFLRPDLSQADSRFVYIKSGDAELIELAKKDPFEFDVHKFVGAIIFDVPEDQIFGLRRQAGKGIVHGTHYGEMPQRISDSLLKAGFEVPVDVCTVGRARYLRRFPAIEGGYQSRVRMHLLHERRLVNSWGRVIRFPYERFDEPLYRRGYAWWAASEVADLLNQWGLVPLDQFILRNGLQSRINLQVHDELLISTNPAECWDIARFLDDSLRRERVYEGVPFSMFTTYAVETRYHSGEYEYKRLPEKDEFMEDFMKLWEVRIR